MEKPKRNHCDSWNLKLFSCDCHNKVAETLELKQQKFIISALEAGHPRSRRQEGWTLLPAVLLARRGHLRHVPSRRLCCFLFLKGQKSEQLRAQPCDLILPNCFFKGISKLHSHILRSWGLEGTQFGP